MPFYYTISDDGDLIPHEYQEGCIASGKKATLPSGRYQTHEGMLIYVGKPYGATHFASSDCLGDGVKGVFNPADGKTYDSRSAYYNAIKAKGLEIVGDEPMKPSKPKLENINWEKAVYETLQKTPLKKGKKKWK